MSGVRWIQYPQGEEARAATGFPMAGEQWFNPRLLFAGLPCQNQPMNRLAIMGATYGLHRLYA